MSLCRGEGLTGGNYSLGDVQLFDGLPGFGTFPLVFFGDLGG